MTAEWQEKMKKIDECIGCGQCNRRCPYKINAAELLRKNLHFYREFIKEHH
jgi:ferredoxin